MNQRLISIVSAMALHHAVVVGRGSDWVASMVDEACARDPIPGTELIEALKMLNREKASEARGSLRDSNNAQRSYLSAR
jgi:hypothetical protein